VSTTEDDLFDRVFDRMSQIELQASLVKTFTQIGDRRGVARQLSFLSTHLSAAILLSRDLCEAIIIATELRETSE
jgi:hypothetical protein